MSSIEAFEQLRALADRGTKGNRERADSIVRAFLKDHDPACREIAEAWEAAEQALGSLWLL